MLRCTVILIKSILALQRIHGLVGQLKTCCVFGLVEYLCCCAFGMANSEVWVSWRIKLAVMLVWSTYWYLPTPKTQQVFHYPTKPCIRCEANILKSNQQYSTAQLSTIPLNYVYAVMPWYLIKPTSQQNISNIQTYLIFTHTKNTASLSLSYQAMYSLW